MSRALPYLIFYSIFFVVLFGVHLYVFLRLKSLLNIQQSALLYGILIALSLSFPLFSLLEKFFPNTLSMILYAAASTWMGVVFLLFSLLLVCEPVRLFVKLPAPAAGITVICIAAVLSVYALYNALFITVKAVDIPMPHLNQPLKLVLLSDIHVGTIHNAGYLNKIVSQTNALNPDMVLITGDLFDGTGPVSKHTVEPLQNFNAKTFFTIGNHERYDGVDRVMNVLADTGVHILKNEVTEYKGIQIVGVDFYEREGRKDNPVLHELPIDTSRPSVLLYHPPVGIEDALKAGINLQLSGHTHNGQLFPFTLLVKLFYQYVCGLYQIEQMYLYVSPGTGTWGPPMRLGSQSEITLINLKKVMSNER